MSESLFTCQNIFSNAKISISHCQNLYFTLPKSLFHIAKISISHCQNLYFTLPKSLFHIARISIHMSVSLFTCHNLYSHVTISIHMSESLFTRHNFYSHVRISFHTSESLFTCQNLYFTCQYLYTPGGDGGGPAVPPLCSQGGSWSRGQVTHQAPAISPVCTLFIHILRCTL